MGLREVAHRVRIWVLKLLSQTAPPTDDSQTERGERPEERPPETRESEKDEITSEAPPGPPTRPEGGDSEPADPDEPGTARESGEGSVERAKKPEVETDSGTPEVRADPPDGTGCSDSEALGPGKPSSTGGAGEGSVEGTGEPDTGTDGSTMEAQTIAPDETVDSNSQSSEESACRDKSDRPPTKQPGKRGLKGGTKLTSRREGGPPKDPYTPQPKLTCGRRGAQWELFLSVPDGCQIDKVQQGTDSLTYDNEECAIQSFGGRLSILYDGGEHLVLPLCEGKPLIFKLGTDWSGIGRHVQQVTHGHFIVIAPNDWVRTGHVPVEPEGCTDEAFLAHYFGRSKGGSDDVGGFEGQDPLDGIAADLEGRLVTDDSTEGGLFGGETAPSLKNSPGVVWVRVGEEREGGWLGDNFRPERKLADVLGERQGRFFVRIYDDQTKLLDSCEFRYIRGLSEIHINDEPYTGRELIAPSSSGHLPARVRFAGTTMLSPDVASDHSSVKEGHILVDPHPDADELRCTLRAGGGAVDVRLNLPRIWWRLEHMGCGGILGSGWSARAWNCTRREFADCAERNAILRVRLPRWVKHCHVGFDGEEGRSHKTEWGATGGDPWGYVAVPLSDFIDHSQITQRLTDEVALNVDCGGTRLTPVRVSQDALPKIVSFACEPSTVDVGGSSQLIWEIEDAGGTKVTIHPELGEVNPVGAAKVTPTRDTKYTLRVIATGLDDMDKTVEVTVKPTVPPPRAKKMKVAEVQGGHKGLRGGKGFSCGELSAADLMERDLSHSCFRIDKRRRTIHPANVAEIRRVANAGC